MHARQGDIQREWCICHLQPFEEKCPPCDTDVEVVTNVEVVEEFFNIEVVDEVFVFAALRHPGFSFDLPLNIKVDAEFYNIEVVD